jgi:hypothetical protein
MVQYLVAVDSETKELPAAVAAALPLSPKTIEGGSVVGDNLVLVQKDGTPVTAGNVRGPKGDDGANVLPTAEAIGAAIDAGAADGRFAKLPSTQKNALTGWFHVDGFAGATPDAKILAAVTAASGVAPVYFQAGTYTLAASVALPASTQLIADPDATVDMGALDYAFSFTGQTGLLIDGLRFAAADAKSEAIRLGSASNKITIRNCVTQTARLVRSNVSTTYANGATDAVKDILVTGNVCETATSAAPSVGAIELRYAERAVISNNVISGFRHGIMYWGGNSNPANDGVLANTRKARDITITGNIVRDCALGGIWGAMGENIAITGNTVRDCGDVGIDVEGSFNASITGNTTANCGNGGIALFYFNRGVVVSGNSCSTNVDGQRLIALYNSATYTENKDVLITGNNLTGVGVIALVGHDTAEDIVVSGNAMRNVRFQWDASNYRHMVITGNTMLFDVVASALFAAILLFKPRDVTARQIARGNTVISTVTQPAGSMGIHAYSDSSNNSPTFVIESNTIVNFPTDIKTSQMSSNAGQTAYFHIRNNVLGAGVYERIEGTTLRSNVLLEGNRLSNQTPFPAAIPSTGKWDRGQQVIYADPATAGYIGAVCTVAGTPGTWKGFGALQP